MVVRADVPPGSAGKRSLQVTATPGADTGGHLYKRLPKGVDRLYARFFLGGLLFALTVYGIVLLTFRVFAH